ncbi:uncharacterized protein LOC107633389 isoform X2 [Arachis ipaensis]|uniref:uncharacterized protein LOC107633389 isoform X2 n=1 Tax=Arachis ipaensis TaxID=130454 RepID=UPI000A2B1787|nr:uncharacterized protein LOC107633389 isoform X2 [Arachis ipaensis]XP_025629294.1 uncharacterized protein LOC112722471 isoform X2 [Arachis hypogaea]
MEEPIKEQPSGGVSAGNSGSLRPKLQRYALRSSIKSKEQKQPGALDRSNSSESNTKRGRITPNVSKSVGVLDFSGKEKSSSAKPPRRQSIPAKSVSTPGPKVVGSVTPISETRTKTQSRSQTPSSDISKTSSRIKFNLLTSASYWLNQIKLSENAAKHSLSFGFFKLALEAGCEPFQRIQDELKSYVQRNQLADLGEEVKELFGSYKIAENLEQLQLQSQSQVSESISQVPDGPRSSDDEVHCTSSSSMATRKLKPKCLDTDSAHLTPVTATESTKKETNQKGTSGSRLRESLRMYSANSKSATIGNRRSVQKSEKQSKNQGKIEKGDVKKDGKKSDAEEATEDNILGNKENMDVGANEGISLTEEVV